MFPLSHLVCVYVAQVWRQSGYLFTRVHHGLDQENHLGRFPPLFLVQVLVVRLDELA